MSFKSFLSRVGAEFHKGFDWFIGHAPGIINAAHNVETLSLPFLQLLFPGIAPAVDAVSKTIYAAVLSVEQKFAAMGQQSGTGPQKAAEVLSIVAPTAIHTLTSLGVQADNAVVAKWIDTIVAQLNALPASVVDLQQAPAPPVAPDPSVQGG